MTMMIVVVLLLIVVVMERERIQTTMKMRMRMLYCRWNEFYCLVIIPWISKQWRIRVPPDHHDRNDNNEDYNTTKGEDITATLTAPLDETGHSDSSQNNNAVIILEIAFIEASTKNKKINDLKEVVMC
jgi:hypothetical protein